MVLSRCECLKITIDPIHIIYLSIVLLHKKANLFYEIQLETSFLSYKNFLISSKFRLVGIVEIKTTGT